MRGQLTSDVSKLLKFPLKPIREEWNSGVEALTDALNLEAQVTRSIRDIVTTCESPKDIPYNDYHVSLAFTLLEIELTDFLANCLIYNNNYTFLAG